MYLLENLLILKDFSMCERSFFFKKIVTLKPDSYGESHPEHSCNKDINIIFYFMAS